MIISVISFFLFIFNTYRYKLIINMGRKKKYKVLKLPSNFDELKSYIKENTLELTEQVLDSINHAIDNDLKFIEVFQFKRSKFSVTITNDSYSDNINNIYDLYIELEAYELCENVLNIGEKLLNKKYDKKI